MIRVILGLILCMLPGVAQACSVCFDANDQNRMAYIGTTVVLSLLPLALIGGALMYIRKKSGEPPEDDSPDLS